MTVSSPEGTYEVPPAKPKRKHPKAGRSIKTVYTLETYQCPDPNWQWVTPWMVNMRIGTDESGWRYNAWFKKSGWNSHAGSLGWAGWVRRREWVRLRCVRPPAKEVAVEQREEVKVGKAHEVFKSEELEENLAQVQRVMARMSVDRRKLEIWRDWLSEANEGTRAKLQAVLVADGAVSTLSRHVSNETELQLKILQRMFTFRSSFMTLLDMLEKHDYSVRSRPSTPSETDHSSPNTPTSPWATFQMEDPPKSPPTAKPYSLET